MLQSHVIEDKGIFLGAAVPLPHAQGFRFVATNPVVSDLDGSIWPTLKEAQRVAAELARTGRVGSRRSLPLGLSAA